MERTPPNSKPSDEVPVAYGYPVGADADAGATVDRGTCALITVMAAMVCVFIILMIEGSKEDKSPRFHLESVSVSSENHANRAAVWDIGFSVDKSVGDLDVWIRFMSRDFKAESVGTAGHATVSVTTSGFYLPGGLVTLEQVMFECNNYKHNGFQAACKDVTVGLLSNETEGVMMGGPRLCPEVHHL